MHMVAVAVDRFTIAYGYDVKVDGAGADAPEGRCPRVSEW
jgi:hypothetical protein